MNLSYIPKHVNNSGVESESEKTHKELNRIAFLLFEKDDPSLKIEFSKIFEKLYDQCAADNYYWQYCTADVYRQTFNIRLDSYLKIYPDAKPDDFINLEFHYLAVYFQRINPEIAGIKYRDHNYYFLNDNNDLCAIKIKTILSEAYRKRIFYSNQRKYEFINGISHPAEFFTDDLPLDYSDNSIAEKIVFLHELGILDFIRNRYPLGMSTNKLAEIISGFTGINQTTAQSYINPIYSKRVDMKNTPLTEKNLKSVKEKLLKIGIYNSGTT